jgi:hypothetical protein
MEGGWRRKRMDEEDGRHEVGKDRTGGERRKGERTRGRTRERTPD